MRTMLHPKMHFELTESLRQHAITNHAKYPQYEGHFDTWIIRQASEHIDFKGYSQFDEGEIILCAPELTVHECIPPTLSAYCPRTGQCVAMPWQMTLEVRQTDL